VFAAKMAVAETAVAYDTLGLFFAVLEAAARFPAWCHCGMVFFSGLSGFSQGYRG